MKKLVCIMMAGLLLISQAGCSSFDKVKKPDENGVLTFKVAHDSADTVPVSIGLFKFAELVEERSDGKIKKMCIRDRLYTGKYFQHPGGLKYSGHRSASAGYAFSL